MNPDTMLTLEEAVKRVLNDLTGLELTYDPTMDRFRSVTNFLNTALRRNALENEWSYYASVETIATTTAGDKEYVIPSRLRPRLLGDDSCCIVKDGDLVVTWAYSLPRDALHKYRYRHGLWYAVTRNQLVLSRPLSSSEAGFDFQIPVMREPRVFRLPPLPTEPGVPIPEVPASILSQPLDFDVPELIIARASMLYAQTDPVLQPRAQFLEAQYKDMMYNLVERDQRTTDTPYLNEWTVPISGSIYGEPNAGFDLHHPHADERGF